MDIVALLHCLHPCLTPTTLRQVCHVAHALLCMTGRVTITGIARWTDKGASYRINASLPPPSPGLSSSGCSSATITSTLMIHNLSCYLEEIHEEVLE
jgi:hypothetical protein